MYPSYIPQRDNDLSLWSLNFTTLLTAVPANYGLTAPDAVIVANVVNPFITALNVATDPGTRTSATIATKDATKSAMLAIVRPYAQRIKLSAAVSDARKIAIGVGIRDTTPSPVPTPTTQPLMSIVAATPLQHEIRYADALTPDKRHKPFGAVALLIFISVGTVAPADPELAPFRALVTKQPYMHTYAPTDVGKTAFVYGRWVTRTGELGPMSALASMVIA